MPRNELAYHSPIKDSFKKNFFWKFVQISSSISREKYTPYITYTPYIKLGSNMISLGISKDIPKGMMKENCKRRTT